MKVSLAFLFSLFLFTSSASADNDNGHPTSDESVASVLAGVATGVVSAVVDVATGGEIWAFVWLLEHEARGKLVTSAHKYKDRASVAFGQALAHGASWLSYYYSFMKFNRGQQPDLRFSDYVLGAAMPWILPLLLK